jgi:hypothetical protein
MNNYSCGLIDDYNVIILENDIECAMVFGLRLKGRGS